MSCIEVKDIAQYEENDSELAKYTILKLQEENKKLKSYMKDTYENKIEEKYIRKLRKIKKQHERFYDNEIIHGEYDGILLQLLKELGYGKIVKMYGKESENFWYC